MNIIFISFGCLLVIHEKIFICVSNFLLTSESKQINTAPHAINFPEYLKFCHGKHCMLDMCKHTMNLLWHHNTTDKKIINDYSWQRMSYHSGGKIIKPTKNPKTEQKMKSSYNGQKNYRTNFDNLKQNSESNESTRNNN